MESSSKRAKASRSSCLSDASGPSPSASSSSGNSTGSSSDGAAMAAGAAPSPFSSTLVISTPPSSLATFLVHDIHPRHGHRLLLPFLRTGDRLRLSVCCQGLLKYRYHLSRVRVGKHPAPTSGKRRGLARLLRSQRLGLEYLCLADASVLRVLELACFEGVTTLNFSIMRGLNEVAVKHLTRALLAGGLKRLEELNLNHSPMPLEGLEAVLAELQDGACPHLRRLKMYDVWAGDDDMDEEDLVGIGHAVAEALGSGQLPHLEELELSWTILGRGGGAAIARALQRGTCPQLVKLDLQTGGLLPEDGRALGEAMRSGSCAKLELLSLGRSEMGDVGCMAVFGALEAGGCLSLKRLDLYETDLSAQSAAALGRALRSGSCHQLQRFCLQEAFKDRHACLAVLQAIKQPGVLPNLRYLNLTETLMDQEHGRALGEAIGGGALPQLEKLCLPRNPSLGVGGVVPTMAGLEGGGCRHLKELSMRGVGMRPQGGQALARALASGHLSQLEDLGLSENDGIGDHALAEVIKGLKECRRTLRSLGFTDVGLGVESGEALVEALGDEGHWPNLEDISMSGNRDLGDGMSGGVGLAEVLEKGWENGKFPRLKTLYMSDCGLNLEGAERLRALIKTRGCQCARCVSASWP